LKNSGNKNAKGYCDANHETGTVADKTGSTEWNQRKWHNNRVACEAAGFIWYEVNLSDQINVDYPVCGFTSFSRVNHLGNAMDDANIDAQNVFEDGGERASLLEDENTQTRERATTNPFAPSSLGAGNTYLPATNNANRFVWTIPTTPTKKTAGSDYFGATSETLEAPYQACTLRIRYNISTSDFTQWPDEAQETAMKRGKMVTAANNTKRNGDEALTPLTQDPYVTIGAGDAASIGEQVN